jgi:hypothetical protein
MVFNGKNKTKGKELLQIFQCLFRRVKVGFGLIFSIAQFYANKYNFLFDSWIGIEFYQTFLELLFYI